MVADLERIPANLAAGIKHESVGFTPFERALFELLSRGMVELRRAGVYESCGKQIEFTTHRRKLLVWTASTEEEQPVSKLAEKIFNLVRNWPEAELSREEVLGPTIGLLWRSLKSELEPDSQLAEGGSVDAAKEAWSSLFPQHPEIASELCKDLAKVGSRGQLKHRKIRWRPFLVFP